MALFVIQKCAILIRMLAYNMTINSTDTMISLIIYERKQKFHILINIKLASKLHLNYYMFFL
jgi:hypothetical protein